MGILARHYEQTQRIEGTIVKHTGTALALDSYFCFCILRLDNGREMEVTLSQQHPPAIGRRIQGECGPAIFRAPKDSQSSPYGGKFIYSSGAPGGLMTLSNVKEVSPLAPTSLIKMAAGLLTRMTRSAPSQ